MCRFLLSGTVALALCSALLPTHALAENAGKSETVMSQQQVEELAASSSAEIVVPFLLFAVVVLALASQRGGGSLSCHPYC